MTTISYPLSIPPVSGIAEITWGREEVRGISESPFTFHRHVYRHVGERWRVTLRLPKMTEANAGAWRGFLLELDGGYGSFLFGDFFNPLPRGNAWGAPVVDGGGQSGKVLASTGWQADTATVLKAGDKIQISSSLYEVTRDVDADSNGDAELNIWPRLRTSPSNGDTIITNAPRGVFQLANPGGLLSSLDITRIMTMPSIEIVEAL